MVLDLVVRENNMINFNSMNDEDLVFNIQSHSNIEESLDELINRHSGLCIDMINGYMGKNLNTSLKEDLIKEKDYYIYYSALKFNPEKGTKFSTYLGNEIKWKCLNTYNKTKNKNHISIENEILEIKNFHENSNLNKDDNEIFDNIISHANDDPDERVGRIFHLRYIEGNNNNVMPWRMVSKKLKMSIQGCINIHNYALQKIKNKLKNNYE